MKTQKVWFGVAGVLVLGASVAAFGKFPSKHDTMASSKAPQSMVSEMSMTEASMSMTDVSMSMAARAMSMSEGKMSMASTTCTPETCGSSVCDGNTCDSPTCAGTSCKSMTGVQHEMGDGMAKISNQGSMQPKMNMENMTEPKM